MKKALVVVAALIAVAAFVGCTNKSKEGGEAGTDTFKVVVPLIGTDVKQGETQVVMVSVTRGEGFKQSVKLQVKAPKGLSVDPGNTTISPSDKGEVQLKITADKDAPLGEQKVMVEGTPDKGDTAEADFKVTVSAK
jgi:uncharacterized membrane protein